MNKMFRDLMVSFVIAFLFLLFSVPTQSSVIDLVIAVSTAGMFSLCSAVVRYVVEEYVSMNKATEVQVERRMQISLVVRDSLFAFVIAYGFMTSSFGFGLSIGQTAGYLVAALAPTIVVAVLSKELRIPFLRTYREHDAVVREMGFKNVA